MRKLMIIAAFIAASTTAFSQSPSNHALGIRFGGADYFGGELSYQQFIGGNNRLEFDLGLEDGHDYGGFKFTLLYQWVNALGSGFYWYVGAGGSIGAFDVEGDGPFDDRTDDGFFLNADGQIGIEYFFPIPLQMSLDLRPEFGLINDDFDASWGFGLRYCF